MEEEQGYRNQGYGSDNSQFLDYNILRLRLDTETILKPIEMYLKGERELVVGDEQGNPRLEVVQETSPKANVAGVNSIMSWLRVTISSQTVQGYIKGFDELNKKLA